MPLNFGSMQSLFPQSRADGDGYGANVEQRRRNEGDLGPSRLSLLHYGEGETTSTTEVELDATQFAAGDFLDREEIFMVINTRNAGAGPAATCKIRFTDSKGSVDVSYPQDIDYRGIDVHVFQMQEDNQSDNLIIRYLGVDNASNVIDGGEEINLTDENVITTALRLSLRGQVTAGGTLYYAWWIYRRGVP